MNDELQRLIDDRNEAENELERFEQELSVIEREFPNSCEDMEEWETLYHEVNEQQNWVNYLNACIESIEGGYED